MGTFMPARFVIPKGDCITVFIKPSFNGMKLRNPDNKLPPGCPEKLLRGGRMALDRVLYLLAWCLTYTPSPSWPGLTHWCPALFLPDVAHDIDSTWF
jgi:hypothetical protein